MTNSNLAKWAAAALAAVIVWLGTRLGLHISGDVATLVALGLIMLACTVVPDLMSVLGHRKGPLSEYVLGHTAGARAARQAAFQEAAALVGSLAAEHSVAAGNARNRQEITDWTAGQLTNAQTYLAGLSKAAGK